MKRPLCSGIVCLIEPLRFPDDEIERLLLYGEYTLPVKVPLVPMVGANAPYTLAGAQTHAEALGSLVLRWRPSTGWVTRVTSCQTLTH